MDIPVSLETAATGFWRVRDRALESIKAGADTGIGVSVIGDGEILLDLRAGFADRTQAAPFGDPLLSVYSVGKVVMASLLAIAVEDHVLDYDAPLCAVWPAFGAAGKDALTLAEVMSHQAGLCGFPEAIDPARWFDWTATADALAAMAPLWPPGTRSGYHPQTIGYLLGEVYRRATGQTFGEALRAHSLDIVCGIDPDDPRIGMSSKPPAPPDLGALTALKRCAFLERWSSPAAGRDRGAWLRSEIPASNMLATARGLAEIGQVLANRRLYGREVVGETTLTRALAPRISGEDLVLPFDLDWRAGPMGNRGGHYGPSPSAVGHYGFGGAMLLIDPAHRLSIGITPNKMSNILVGDPRALAIVEAVYDILP